MWEAPLSLHLTPNRKNVRLTHLPDTYFGSVEVDGKIKFFSYMMITTLLHFPLSLYNDCLTLDFAPSDLLCFFRFENELDEAGSARLFLRTLRFLHHDVMIKKLQRG